MANASVAQLAEHLICNQAVASSILAVSSDEPAGASTVRSGLRVGTRWGTQVANGSRL